MSLHFKKLLSSTLCFILTAFLLIPVGTKAYAETSYIIVHALNQEGIEIASIEKMDSDSVQIYDGDTLIGYGAHHNPDTYGQPIAISAGQHTIKAKFNGITKEMVVTLSPNETKEIVFTFERTEFDLVGHLNSVKLDYKYELEKHYSLYEGVDVDEYVIPTDIHKDLFGVIHVGGNSSVKGNGVDIKAYLEYYIDGKNYRSRIVCESQLTGDLSQFTQANVYAPVCTDCRGQTEDGSKWPDVAIVPGQSFDNWFVQPHNYVDYYPGLIFARKDAPEIYQAVGPGDHVLEKLPARYAYRKAIWGHTGTGSEAPVTQDSPHAYEDEDFPDGSVDWFMSSVPFDFYNSGFKYEEIIKIPLGAKDFPCTDKDKTYRIYIPSRYGGILTVSADAGVIELFYPNSSTKISGPATKIDYSVPVDSYGWYYVKYSGTASCNITNTFEEKGEVSYRPWNFWFYPFNRAQNPLKNFYGSGGILEKYDAVFGTAAKVYEEQNYSYSSRDWGGHCWGGSIASILLSLPPEQLPYGDKIFSQEEIKGLETKLADTKAKNVTVLVKNIPAVRPKLGPDDTDKFVIEFHKGLLNLRAKEMGARKPIQSNLRDSQGNDPDAIWNHAIYKYVSTLEESEEGNENIIRFTTTTYANNDTIFPSNNTKDRTDTYVYKLKYSDGEINTKFTNADWVSATGFAPGWLYVIGRSEFDGKGIFYNPEVKKSNAEKLGISFPN